MVFFLVILVIELALIHKSEYLDSILLVFLVLISINILKNTTILISELREESKINNEQVEYWNGKNFELTLSEKLIVGNIVKIYERQRCPADVLVLFSSNTEGVFYSDLENVVGKSSVERKISVFETQVIMKNGVEEGIKEKILGKILLNDPNSNFCNFSGKICLVKHPRFIGLSYGNLLINFAKLAGVNFVIGVVVYAGVESKVCSCIARQDVKRNYLRNRLNVFIYFYLFLFVTLVSVCAFIAVDYSGDHDQGPVLLIIEELIHLFSNIIPISMFISYELLIIIFALILHYDSNKRLQVLNLDILENLKSLKYIVTSTTGTITENEFKVTICMIQSKLYKKSVNFLTISHIEQINEEISLFSQLDQDFSDLRDDLNKDKTLEYFKCLLLCNLKLDNKESSLKGNEEFTIIEFGKELGAYVYSVNIKSVILSIDGQLLACNVVIWNKGKNNRVIIENNDEDWVLYVRGTEKKLLDKLEIDPDTKEILYPKIEKYKLQGLSFLILGRKILNPLEISYIKSEISNAESFLDQKEKRLEKMFHKLERSCKYIGLCGMEDSVKPETVEAISSIRAKGVKMWVASSDKKTSTLSACLKSGIIDSDTSFVYIRKVESYSMCVRVLADAILRNIFLEDSSYECNDRNILDYKSSIAAELLSDINSTAKLSKSFNSYNLIYEEQMNSNIKILEEHVMKKIEEPINVLKSKFYVLIDKTSFRTALSNPNTIKLLTCLLFSAENVCFYKLLIKDKQDIISLMKENLSFRPYVGAVGGRIEDIPMMQSADIGFYLNKSLNSTLTYHDIKLTDYSELKDLIQLAGPSIYKKLSTFFLIFLYKNLFNILVIITYMTKSDYSLNSFYNKSFKIFYNTLATIPLIAITVDKADNNCIYHKQKVKFHWFGEISARSVAVMVYSAAADCVVVYLFLLYSRDGFVVNRFGMTEDGDIMALIVYLSVVWVFWIEVMRNVVFYSAFVISSYVFSFFMLVTFVVLMDVNGYLEFDGIYQHFLMSPILMVQVLMVGFASLVVKTWSHCFLCLVFEAKDRFCRRVSLKRLTTIYRRMNRANVVVSDLYDTYRYSLKFVIGHIEKMYQLNFINSNIKVIRVVIFIIAVINCLWAIIDPLVSMPPLKVLVANSLFSIFILFISLSTFTSFFKSHYTTIILLFILIGIISKLVIDLISGQSSLLLTGITPSLTYIFFNVDFIKISILNVLGIIEYLIVLFVWDSWLYVNLKVAEIFTKIMIINISSAFLARAIEITYRQEYKLIKIQEQNYEKTQRILCVLLPCFVRKRVKDGVRYIAEDQGTVSIIFCDIDNFDVICSQYSPSELLCFLDSFFQKLDTLCRIHGVSKIETVGKTYMACAGLRDSEAEMDITVKSIHHTKRAINFSLAIIEEAERFPMKNLCKLGVKVGINSGPVTAGVVGYHKPQFSLVGDTVNTASRMCTTLQTKNSIQISSNTFHMIPDTINLKFTSSTVFAKGKGEMSTFIVIPGFSEPTLTYDDTASYKNASAITGINHDPRIACESLGLLEMKFRSGTFFYRNKAECFFKFRESEKEKQVRINRMESNKEINTPIFFTCLVNFLTEICVSVYEMRTGEGEGFGIFVMRCCCFCMIMGVIGVFKKVYLKRFYSILILVLVYFLLSTTCLEEILLDQDIQKTNIHTLDYMFIYLILIYCSGFSSRSLTFLYPTMILPKIYITSVKPLTYQLIFDLFLLTLFYIINTSAIFNRETQIINYFHLKATTETELSKTDNLLKQMMPAHVLENMKNHKTLNEKLPNVTLLYSDIVGFTEWSSNKSPKEVVSVLSEIFSRFDKLCITHNVYKVHTIGDCYVVLGNLDHSNRNPSLECLNVVNMALAMSESLNEVNEEMMVGLNMRVGIHTGSIIAGIVGTDIVRYDVYGPDVLIANQMESNSIAGAINVSETTKELLSSLELDTFEFEFNKEVKFVNINRSVTSYFLKKLIIN